MDHQMNLLLAEKFGQYFVRLPLKKSARIVHDNALRLNWRHVLNPAECSYILGNPPFVGAKFQSGEQRADMAAVAGDAKSAGLLDYVTAWYFKAAFLASEPAAAPFFRRWLGSEEFINGVERWCLLLRDCLPDQLRRMPEAVKRVLAVRSLRLASKSLPTQKLAATPTRFHVENFPKGPFLVIPGVSSERRPYIPIGYLTPDTLASNLLNVIPDATLFHFGVLTSTMHMAWVRQVCGRLESRYRYSNKLVYNNFPWPQFRSDRYVEKSREAPLTVKETSIGFLTTSPDEFGPGTQRAAVAISALGLCTADGKKFEAVEGAAQAVLDARANYPTSTLADLYDPLTMPPELLKAHAALDRAVDRCYRAGPFTSDRQRVEFLFTLYERYTAPLLPAEKMRKRR